MTQRLLALPVVDNKVVFFLEFVARLLLDYIGSLSWQNIARLMQATV